VSMYGRITLSFDSLSFLDVVIEFSFGSSLITLPMVKYLFGHSSSYNDLMKPKSDNLTVPRSSTIRFEFLRSRWTIPLLCNL